MAHASNGTKASNIGAGLLVSLCGLATSLITAVILWWIEHTFGFAFYSWMFWFIIPIGALISGMAGASGYYIAAKIIGYRPTSFLLAAILIGSVATFFVIQFLSYITLEVNGKAVSDFVSFFQYLDITIQSMTMTFRHRASAGIETGELGMWGYGVTILQILGFAVGGFLVYSILSSLPYCERCSRYFASKGSQTRYTGDPQALQTTAVEIVGAFGSGAVASAMAAHNAFGDPKFHNNTPLRSTIEVHCCKECGQHRVKYGVEKKDGKDWKAIPNMTATAFTDQAVEI